MAKKKSKYIEDFFVERISGVDAIFESYRTLYEIYGSLLNSNGRTNAGDAYKSMKKSADAKAEEVSSMLYKQGYVIMVGAAESLLKDVFRSLLIEDFSRLIKGSKVNFSAKEIQETLIAAEESTLDSSKHISARFGRLMYEKLQSTKDPENKINFQNVKQMEGMLRSYFGLEIDNEELLNRIHRHWQVRHIIAHNDSVVDASFVTNVNQVGLLRPGEERDKKIVVAKQDYNDARDDFLNLFTILTSAIQLNDLDTKYIKQRADEPII